MQTGWKTQSVSWGVFLFFFFGGFSMVRLEGKSEVLIMDGCGGGLMGMPTDNVLETETLWIWS